MERVYDQEIIYARVIGLLASSRDVTSMMNWHVS